MSRANPKKKPPLGGATASNPTTQSTAGQRSKPSVTFPKPKQPKTNEAASAKLEPDREELAKFCNVIFKHATPGTRISLRSFKDDTSTFDIQSVIVDQGNLVDEAVRLARNAANAEAVIVFAPPIATFVSEGWQAREVDLAEGLTISVECDKRPQHVPAVT